MNETTDFSLFPGSHRLADLARRVPRAAWPFIVLAALQTILFVGLGYLDFRNIAIWVIPPLFPVAVLIGRRDAWKSARVIMIGAILWGSVECLVQVFGLGQQRFAADPGADTTLDFIVRVAVRLASLIAIAAPALVLLGLRTRRRTETTWPKALVAVAIVVTVGLCVYDANQAIQWQQPWHNFGYYIDISLRDQLDVLAQGLEPLRLLALGALAWSTISAVRAREAPRRFWLAIGAGSTVLFAASLYSTVMGPIMESGPIDSPVVASLLNVTFELDRLALLVGLALLLIGFGLGLPDSDEDALGEVLPDESATGNVIREAARGA
jgi:hypothetical protein